MLWILCLRSLPDQPGRRKRGPSLVIAGPPLQTASPPSLATLPNAGCTEKSVFGSSLARYGTQVSDHCDSGQNKTQTFSKREKASFSASHKRPALMQPACTAVSTPCHTGWGPVGVSAWVMNTVRWGYSLQFARRPPRFRLKQRVPAAVWRYGCHRVTVTWACVSALTRWRKPLWLKRGVTRHGVQKEGCHDRRFQQGLGSAVQGQTDLRSVVRGGIDHAHQLPRNASSMSGLSILPTGHTGTSCANTLRQQVRGVIHKSPGRPHLERLCMLANNLLVWAQNNLRSLKAMHVQGKMNRGKTFLRRNGHFTGSRFRKCGKSLARLE